MLFLFKRERFFFLQVKEHIGKADIPHDKEMIDNPAGGKYMLGVETKYLHRRFYYGKLEGETKTITELPNVYYLCDEGVSMGKRFTGAMVGMYGYAGEKPLFIEYEDFRYQEL